MNRNLSFALALATFLLFPPSQASAFWGDGGYGGYPWGGYSWGWGTACNSNYGWNYVPPPPYFAVHPPVYYSHQITARHYGASPYAWTGGMQPITYVAHSAAAPRAQPLMIENPYVKSTAPARAASEPIQATETQPVSIDNPYLAQVAR